jgi:hypothetical protein
MIRTDRAEEALAAGLQLIAGTSIVELMPADVV